VQNKINKAGSDTTYRGVCSNTATTYAKVVECTGFELTVGASIVVYMAHASTTTSTLTLNVNNTGAKTIYVGDKATSANNQLLWAAGASITFTYDGDYWVVADSPGTWSGGMCTSSADSNKTALCPKVVLFSGASVKLMMQYENTNGSTLNVQLLGQKYFVFGSGNTVPSVNNGYSWRAGSIVEFVFDGLYWRTGSRTYVDGGSIVTGKIDTNRLDATSIQTNIVKTCELNADMIKSGTISGVVFKSTPETNERYVLEGYVEIAESRLTFRNKSGTEYARIYGYQTDYDQTHTSNNVYIDLRANTFPNEYAPLTIAMQQYEYGNATARFSVQAHQSWFKMDTSAAHGEINIQAGTESAYYGLLIDSYGIHVRKYKNGSYDSKTLYS
jgi:hypothetical protein